MNLSLERDTMSMLSHTFFAISAKREVFIGLNRRHLSIQYIIPLYESLAGAGRPLVLKKKITESSGIPTKVFTQKHTVLTVKLLIVA